MYKKIKKWNLLFKLFKINFVLILSMSTGIIVYNNQLEKKFVNELEVVEMNTALLNDKVSITKEGIVEKILKRDETEIYGILKLTSRVKQGSNKRGVPIYLFKPYQYLILSFLSFVSIIFLIIEKHLLIVKYVVSIKIESFVFFNGETFLL